MQRPLVIGFLLLVALQLAACGDSEGTGASSDKPDRITAAEEKPAVPLEEADPGDWAALKRLAGPHANRLVIPQGPAPERIVVRDLKPGKGPVVQPGDFFRARYVSFTYDDGWAVEPYWSSPSTYTAEIGSYIEGWEVGLKRIRIGGIRELIVPSSMAYGNGARVYIVQPLRLE